MRTAVRYKTIKTTFNRILQAEKTRLLRIKAITAAKFIHILKKAQNTSSQIRER